MTMNFHVKLIDRPDAIIYRFVDVLVTAGRLRFEYATMVCENLPAFLVEFWGEPELMQLVDDLREMSYDEIDTNWRVFKACQNALAIQDSLCLYLNWRIKRCGVAFLGRRIDAPDHRLYLWVTAYALAIGRGRITVHERYAEALKSRHADGVRQYVLSCMLQAPVDSDRRLCAFTTQGDLTPYIDGFFCAGMAPNDDGSYALIARMLNIETNKLLVITTKLDECHAASSAGCAVMRVKRPNVTKDRVFIRIKDMSCIAFPPKPPTKLSLNLKKSNSTTTTTDNNNSKNENIGGSNKNNKNKKRDEGSMRSKTAKSNSQQSKKSEKKNLEKRDTSETNLPNRFGSPMKRYSSIVSQQSSLNLSNRSSDSDVAIGTGSARSETKSSLTKKNPPINVKSTAISSKNQNNSGKKRGKEERKGGVKRNVHIKSSSSSSSSTSSSSSPKESSNSITTRNSSSNKNNSRRKSNSNNRRDHRQKRDK